VSIFRKIGTKKILTIKCVAITGTASRPIATATVTGSGTVTGGGKPAQFTGAAIANVGSFAGVAGAAAVVAYNLL
jgi:hypothetical protein